VKTGPILSIVFLFNILHGLTFYCNKIKILIIPKICFVDSSVHRKYDHMIIVGEKSDPFNEKVIDSFRINTTLNAGTVQDIFYLSYPEQINNVNVKSKTKTLVKGLIILNQYGFPSSFFTTTEDGSGWQLGSSFDKKMKCTFCFFNTNIYVGSMVGPIIKRTWGNEKKYPCQGNTVFGTDSLNGSKNLGSYNTSFGFNNNETLIKGDANVTIGSRNAIYDDRTIFKNQFALKDDFIVGKTESSTNQSNYNIILGNEVFCQGNSHNFLVPNKQNICIGNMSVQGFSGCMGNIVVGNNTFFTSSLVPSFHRFLNNIVIGNGIVYTWNDKYLQNLNQNIIIFPGSVMQEGGMQIHSGLDHCVFLGTLGSIRRNNHVEKSLFLNGTDTIINPVEGTEIPFPIYSCLDGMTGMYNITPLSKDQYVDPNIIDTVCVPELLKLSVIGIKNILAPEIIYFTIDPKKVVDDVEIRVLSPYLHYSSEGNLLGYDVSLLLPLVIRAVQMNQVELQRMGEIQKNLIYCINFLLKIIKNMSEETSDNRSDEIAKVISFFENDAVK